MKYSDKNQPIACMLTNNVCYKKTTTMIPRGVLWHDTDAKNPYISRYVQPMETDENYEEMIALLGKNRYGNDWNHSDRRAGVNCFIGRLADDSIATIQTMPWNYAPWGCGSGVNGSFNNTHMQFEICDDGYKSKEYFEAVYKEACEITAYYCKKYKLDPMGTFVYKGKIVPVITNHDEAHTLGFGSNHSDTNEWMSKFGKTMDDARRDVAKLMGIEIKEKSEEKSVGLIYTKGKSTKITQNFTSTEFDCKGKGCCTQTIIDKKLVELLQDIRSHFGKPVIISSAYRCATHNKKVDGATGSYHTKGQAADIYISGIKPIEIARYAENIGILGIGLYETDKDGHFVHIDTRTTKSFWYGQAQESRSTFKENKTEVSKVDTSTLDPKQTWDFLKNKGLNDFGIAGLMGNLHAESGLKSIAQLEFLVKELNEDYKEVWNVLKTATSVVEASNIVMLQYMRPADQSLTAQTTRAKYGQTYYDKYKVLKAPNTEKENYIFKENDVVKIAENAVYYSGKTIPSWVKENTWIVSSVKGDRVVINKSVDGKHSINSPVNAKNLELVSDNQNKSEKVEENFCSFLVKVNTEVLNYRSGPGLEYKVKGTIRRDQVYTIIEEKDGWGKLKSGAGWISLSYTKKI